MKLKNVKIEKFDIVIVAEKGVSDFVMPYRIRKILGEDSIIRSFDNITICQKEPEKVQVQFEPNRLIIGIHRVENNLEEDLVSKFASYVVQLFEIIKELEHKRFGFNYHGQAEIDDNFIAVEFFRGLFLPSQKELAKKIGGSITKINPNFFVEKEDCLFNIKITPKDNQEFTFHCNAHFEKAFNMEKEGLEKSLVTCFEEFIEILNGLER